MPEKKARWKIAVDRGGTFTDLVAVDPAGRFHTGKILSQSPEYENASIEGIRRMLNLSKNENIYQADIEAIRFGTTVATNALLERKGGKVALLITKGLPDLLEISNQTRPEIFNLKINKPSLLYDLVIEVDERIGPSGNVVKKLDENLLEENINLLITEKVDAVAVVLMHSWKNPQHELMISDFFFQKGIKKVFLSHQTVNQIKIVSRGQSTVLDAYLSPVIAMYLEGIKTSTGRIPVEFIQSSGGLSQPLDFKGKDALLSGPAGGVVAVGKIADQLGLKGVIGFDMGGTSTDVSRYDGQFEKIYEQVIAGVELQKESLNINTIASGGGSILWFDGQKMKVGPESAGALPGPACYGFNGPLTITDANLMAGRLIPEYFPKAFGPHRNAPLAFDIVEKKFKKLAEEISAVTKTTLTPCDAALGFIQIANEKMALAIKEISVSKGFDVRDYALVCFGGAGGQHACKIASILGIKKIIFHPLSGLMSAYGIGLANPIKTAEKTILKPFERKNYESLINIYNELLEELSSDYHLDVDDCIVRKEVGLRPVSTDAFLTVNYNDIEPILKEFTDRYQKLYGFDLKEVPLEIVNIRVSIEQKSAFFSGYTENKELTATADNIKPCRKVYYPDGIIDAPLFTRELINPGDEITGPAFIIDKYSTLIVEKNFKATMTENGIILLEGVTDSSELTEINKDKPDPVLLEVFNNNFMGIATEMGHTLRNTSHSVNIKERLDYSCAIFDGEGNLVANAPHIPVHLGSMTDTVKSILEDRQDDIKPGDVFITNDPYRGGSHLPDITVVCPVFDENGEIIFFTAARGHHADVGGATPGSLPPIAHHISDEGVLISNFLAVRDGQIRENELRQILMSHQYPVRNIEERIYDLKAQMASCYKGMKSLNDLVSKYGWVIVSNYMAFIQDNAEFSVKQALSKFLAGRNNFEADFLDRLDDGTIIKVKITIMAGDNPPYTIRAIIDFNGTGEQHTKDNLNTPLSVTRSAILYVMRSITDVDIPLNNGCIKPIEIIVPEGSILNPVFPVPVASGNVETSQRIVDVLLGALKVAAASQGTMNNFLFQVEGEIPYYETIAGGAGALKGHSGASSVQVHMTNTRITDPEILEYRHPGVRLEQFKVRRNSGGNGEYPGGDGVTRELKFLQPSIISIISERRTVQPYGMAGGQSASSGINSLRKSTGEIIPLPHRVAEHLEVGDSIIIETPGGGGYGSPKGH